MTLMGISNCAAGKGESKVAVANNIAVRTRVLSGRQP